MDVQTGGSSARPPAPPRLDWASAEAEEPLQYADDDGAPDELEATMMELVRHHEKRMADAIDWFAENKTDLRPILTESVIATLNPEVGIVLRLVLRHFFSGSRLRKKLVTFILADGNPRAVPLAFSQAPASPTPPPVVPSAEEIVTGPSAAPPGRR